MQVFNCFKQSKFRISSSGGHQLELLGSPSRQVKTQRQDGLRNPPTSESQKVENMWELGDRARPIWPIVTLTVEFMGAGGRISWPHNKPREMRPQLAPTIIASAQVPPLC